MSNIIKCKMKLEVLTPLHIGGADYKSKLDKKEYVFDKDKGTLTLIDSEKFISFLIKKNLFDDYIFYIQKNLNLKKHEQDKNIKLIDFLKSRDIYKNIEEFRKKAPIKIDAEIEEMNDIKLMLRNLQEKPYIPGSSIKGAIINFLLVNYIINHRDKFKIERNKILEIAKKANNDNDIKKAKNDIKRIVNEIEKSIIYGDNKELEKSKRFGISVSDTYNYSNTRTYFYRDIDEKRDKSKEEKEQAIPVYREYIMANSIFDFDVTLDIDLMEKSKFKIKNISNLTEALENTSNYLINNILKDKNSPQIENLILGANTGFLQKTIIYSLFEKEEERLEVIKKLLHLKKGDKIKDHLKDKFSPRVLNRIKINGKNYLAGLVKIMKVEEKNVGTN
ncbi:type III-A CRISPR-associated RAMP protein Csm5 [Fusobacterium polymorphum]|uniref:CRISPR system Cms protein Csm5 n=1 Tax=Fusobacterium nucleatum subsp. polymorphum TaxID=76857 RepID=A0A2B7YLM0_FUSNP|nr:type III-A CRISPR-associated RAMP protein Csm5 [Fusobacterium polymorphum]PGH21971.1 type III-A CRISPR-associated RAMP protein Csm5 [Fusobacterium polymorphum]